MTKARNSHRQPPRSGARRLPDRGAPVTSVNPAKKIEPTRNTGVDSNIRRLSYEHPGTIGYEPCPRRPRRDRIDTDLNKWERGLRLRSLALRQINDSAGSRKEDRHLIGNKNNVVQVSEHDKAPTPGAAVPTISSPSTNHVRAKRQLLLKHEQKERRRLVKEYKVTGNPRVFAPFLKPFIHSQEFGEWCWDDEVERWWREDKETGARLWEPLDESFV